MAATQTYATHRRWYPLYHFVVLPIFSINLLLQLWVLYRHPGFWSVWNVVVACGLVAVGAAARLMATRVQDRIIRLEERLRLQQILPEDLRGRIGELRARQLVAIRFCDDAETPELCRAVLNGEVTEPDQIKRRIRTWRPDTLRA